MEQMSIFLSHVSPGMSLALAISVMGIIWAGIILWMLYK